MRLPDYIIIGMMKSGTTSLYTWLSEQPECAPATHKEINFFSRDDLWQRGLPWYSTFFVGAGEDKLVGEASTSYTKPTAPAAAARMAATAPTVRLIYLLRHPIERLRSQYRHEIRRSREKSSLLEALQRPNNDYLRLSLYYQRLVPYIEAFPREQICVVRFEDLVSPPAPGWDTVVSHLGLPARPVPGGAHNVTSEKAHFTPLTLRLWSSDHYGRAVALMPKQLRRFGRAALIREGPKYAARLEQSRADIPPDLLAPIWDDVDRLQSWLGVDRPLWEASAAGSIG